MKKNLLFIFTLFLSNFLFAQNNTLNFDGTDDYVQVPYNAALNPAAFTVEAWVNVDAIKDEAIISSRHEASSTRYGYTMYITSTNQIEFQTGSGVESADWDYFRPSYTVTTGWTHIAIIYSSTTKKVYVNGVLVGTKSVTYAANPSSPLRIGAGAPEGSAQYFADGKIDEVRIWNDERTETEIRQNMYRELPDPSSETNLIAYYKFNETSGTTLTDSKGSNNGTLTNMAGNEWQTSPAMFGPKNGLDFDGTYDHIEISSLHLSGSALTVEAWVYPRSFNSASPDANVSNLFRGGNEYVVLRIGDYGINDQPEFVVSVGGTQYKLMADNVLSADTWYHIAGVYDGSTMKLYIDGELVASQSQTGSINTTSESFALGGELGSTPNRCFDGLMDEVRIWSDARTASEIRENMCKNLTSNESGLAAYYNFDNSSGTILQDYSGNSNDGTLTNMDGSSDWVASSAFNTWLNTSSSSWSVASNWSRGSTPSLIEPYDNLGIYSYSGGTDLNIDYSEPGLNNMVLGSNSSVTLSFGLLITGNLILESNFDLNGETVYLEVGATLIEDNGRLYGSSGDIRTQRNLSNIDENVAGLGAEITTSANMGSTTIIRSHAASSNPSGITRKYQITPSTNTGLNATLVFHYDDNEIHGLTEANLKLYKSTDGTSWTRQNSSSVNTTDNTLTLTGLDGFSYWTASDGLHLTGNALDFDGTDDYVSTSNLITSGNTFTIEIWVYARTFNGSGDSNISNLVVGGDENTLLRIGDGGFDNNQPQFVVDVSGHQRLSANMRMDANKWYHLAGVYDGSTMKLYVNGELDNSQSQSGTIETTITSVRIGGNTDNTRMFDGKMDEIRIWNTARTASEIRENMCKSLVGNESGLVAYYNCNFSSGTTLYDITGNEKTGTLNNGTAWVSSDAFNIWLGETSNAWSTDANWSLGTAPNSTTSNVSITDRTTTYAPQIASSITLNNLIVTTGKTTDISAGNSLTVNNLYNYGTFTVNSDASSNGSLIVNGDSDGNITYNRYIPNTNWQLISAPVAGQAINASFISSNSIASQDPKYGLAPYDNTTPGWAHFTTETIASAGNFVAGKGYEVLRSSAGTISFTGTLATENVSIPITKNTSAWNLIGNPYSSALNGNSPANDNNFLTVNSESMDAGYRALYIWDSASQDYLTVNNSSDAFYLAPGQAFFANSKEGGATVNFTEAMQTHQTGNFFKSGKTPPPSIKLIAETSDKSATTNIKYIDNMTTGLDPGYDAGRFSGADNSFAVYTHLAGDQTNQTDLDIQCLPAGEFNHIIPVGLNAPENSKVVFRTELVNLPLEVPVYLEDRASQTFTELQTQGNFYEITLTAQSEGTGRFFIHTQSINTGLGVVDSSFDFTIIPLSQQNSLRLIGEFDKNMEVTLYDIAGRKIITKKLNVLGICDVDMHGRESGVYIVSVSSPLQKISKKIGWIKND